MLSALLSEADELRQQFAALAATPSRRNAAQARTVLHRHQLLRELLHHNIDSLAQQW